MTPSGILPDRSLPFAGRRRRLIAGILALAALTPPPGSAAESGVPGPPREPWISTGLRDHPLAGRIWETGSRRFRTPEELVGRLAGARLILLGETHDNPDHHRIQAWIVARLLADGRRPGLALEMWGEDQQAAIDSHLSDHPGDAAGLGPATGWAESGWPAFGQYLPVIAPVVARNLPLMAANLPRRLIRPVMADGLAALGAARREALGLDRPLSESLTQSMAREIIEAHCGQLSASRAATFVHVQIARDAVLADGLIRAARIAGDGAILIAGSGHVRTDRGVPRYLRLRGAGGPIVSVAAIEVSAGRTDPADYAEAYGGAELPFDHAWFTPRRQRQDPCKAFNKKQ